MNDNVLSIVVFLVALILWGVAAAITLYGLISAFFANVLLGILFLFVTPLSFVNGLMILVFHYNVGEHILNLL